MLLIGSYALRAHGIECRTPVDRDYIATYEEYTKFIERLGRKVRSHYPVSANKFVASVSMCHEKPRMFEFEIAWPGSTAEWLLNFERQTVASLDACLALKLSHRYLRNSPHFLKTMEDIWLLRRLGVTVPDSYQRWFKAREKETYNYTHPNLNQSKKNFFDASVKYVYDHDAVHRAVAVECHPAYTFYKDDAAEVKCSKEKFFALPEEVRLNGVLEEAYVLAIERSIVPHPGVMTPRKAFEMALMKVCTSITSGWFRNFAWENYYKVLELYSDAYVTKFQSAVAAGEVPFQQD